MCEWVFACMLACAPLACLVPRYLGTCMPGYHDDQKRVQDSLGLGLQMVVSPHVGTGIEPRCSGTVCALKVIPLTHHHWIVR